jgi:hypothetical protein
VKIKHNIGNHAKFLKLLKEIKISLQHTLHQNALDKIRFLLTMAPSGPDRETGCQPGIF